MKTSTYRWLTTTLMVGTIVGMSLTSAAEPPKPPPGPTGTVAGKISVKGKPAADRSGMVVSLEGVPSSKPVPPAVHPQIRQHDLKFLPEVMVIVKGTTVDFPNDDKIFHNVFSLSETSKFDLGLYKSGDSKSVTFKKKGVADIYCNIHPDMVAKVMVVDTSFYSVAKADGSFKIENVPVGTYPVNAWQPWGQAFKGTVTVTAGATATLNIELVEGPKGPHLNKLGTPYGAYK
jgi:plastocyanin